MAKNDTAYVCTVGMDSGETRMERGHPYTGKKKSIPWLVEQGHIVEAGSDDAAAILAELAAENETEG